MSPTSSPADRAALSAARRSRELTDTVGGPVVDVDPELLLPYVLDRRGASQNALLELLADALEEGHRDGSIRAGHPERQARSVLLIVQSFTLSLRTMTDEEDADLSSAAFLTELRSILERTLTP